MKFHSRHILIAVFTFALLVVIGYVMQLPNFRKGSAASDQELPAADTARALFSIGVTLTDQSRYDSSLAYFEKAAAIYKKDGSWEDYVNCMNYLGDNYRRIGNYDTAYTLLTATIDLSVQQLGEMHASTAMAINKLGLWYRDKGEYEKALINFNRALSIRLRVLPQDHMDIGWSYNNLGIVQYDFGNFETALRSYQKVVPVFIKNLGPKSGPLALLYNNIAITFEFKGNQEKALEYHNLAIEMRTELFGSDHITLAQSYGNIGNVYMRTGDYDKAFKFYNRALSIRTIKLGPYHPDIGDTYYNLGFAYKETGLLAEALKNYRIALTIYEKNFGSQHPLIARTCDEIGGQLLAQNQFDSALVYFNRALLIWTDKPGIKGYRRSYEFSHIGTTYLKKGNFDEALKFYRQALSVNKEYYGEKHEEVSQSYSDMAKAYLTVRDYDEALRYIDHSINALVWNNSNDITEIKTVNAVKLLFALDMKGDILREMFYKKTKKTEDLRSSFSAFETAILLLDKIRREYSSEDSKLLIGQKINRIFEKGIRTAYELHTLTRDSVYNEKAFQFSEKSKVAILAEAIRNEQAKIYAGIPDSLLDYEDRLRARIGFYNKKLFAEQNTGGYGSKKYRSIQDEIFRLTTEYDKHVHLIEQSYPEYYDLKYRPSVISLKEVQKSLPDSTALIEYFFGDQHVSAFCVNNKKSSWFVLNKDSTILTKINSMRTGLETQEFESYARSAYSLYKDLIGSLEIPNTSHLIIIPDGQIATIPFEALLSEPSDKIMDYSNLAYLIKNFSISYAYSATLLYHNPDFHKNTKNNLIGFSPSIFK